MRRPETGIACRGLSALGEIRLCTIAGGFRLLRLRGQKLTNPSDPFYQHQGNCFPTLQQIVSAVQAHEIGLPGPSHYSELVADLQSNNPATAAEAVVDAPESANTAIAAVYQAAQNAAAVEVPTNLPANINYPPYRTCP